MLEHRGHARFAKKTPLLEGVVCDLLKQALVGDDAAEVIILAGLDQTFSTLGDRLELRVTHVRIHHMLWKIEIRVLQIDGGVLVLGMRKQPRHFCVPMPVAGM